MAIATPPDVQAPQEATCPPHRWKIVGLGQGTCQKCGTLKSFRSIDSDFSYVAQTVNQYASVYGNEPGYVKRETIRAIEEAPAEIPVPLTPIAREEREPIATQPRIDPPDPVVSKHAPRVRTTFQALAQRREEIARRNAETMPIPYTEQISSVQPDVQPSGIEYLGSMLEILEASYADCVAVESLQALKNLDEYANRIFGLLLHVETSLAGRFERAYQDVREGRIAPVEFSAELRAIHVKTQRRD